MFACCGSRHDKSGRPPGCFGTWMAGEYIPSWEAGGVKGPGNFHWAEGQPGPHKDKKMPGRMKMTTRKKSLSLPKLAKVLAAQIEDCGAPFTGWLSLDVYAPEAIHVDPQTPATGVPVMYWQDSRGFFDNEKSVVQVISEPLLTGNEKEGTISFRFFMFLHMPSAPFLKIYIPTFGTMTYVIKDRLVVKQTEEWDGSFLGTTLTHTLNMWEPSVAEFRKLAPNKLTNPQSGTKYELKESLKP